MKLSIEIITLFTAVLLTGLSAGFFYTWAVSVIPGTKKITTPAYLETMQSINREILNPWFFAIFFGCLIILVASTILQHQTKPTFWLLLSSSLIYAIGTFGVTAFGNVPLNDALEAVDLNTLDSVQLADFRGHYEVEWNRLHMIRTVSALVSFLLSLAASFTTTYTI
jgi:uncharacterized membrane protein